MVALTKLPSAAWRALVWRKLKTASRTFRLKVDAEAWAIAAERSVDTGIGIDAPRINRRTTFGNLVQLRLKDRIELVWHHGASRGLYV